MSNVIGDLLWNYLSKQIQAVADIPKSLVATLAKDAVQEAKREIALKSIDVSVFKDPVIRDSVAKMKEEWQHSPEGSSDIARDLISLVSGRAALVQLEYIAGVKLDRDNPISARMFDQIAVITDIAVLSNTLKIIGSLIPTTNAQYMGVALDDYLNSSGITQITGFGYGMLFSNVVSPLVSYELNQKLRPTLPASADVIRMGQRQKLTDTDVTTALSKMGFNDVYQAGLKELALYFPPPVDLIRFAVRDTFKEDIVRKYGYDNDYPSDIDAQAVKAGMSPEWMKHYWRAHWSLPSPQMGFEMLHRDKITMDDLTTLLRISDMAPYWIDKVIGISYSPYTRVDIRRLFADGEMTKDEVYRAYKDIGYDDDHATKLTAWTTKAATTEKKEKVKDLTESAVLRAYKFGQKNAEDTTKALKTMGYDDSEAALILAIADYASWEDELNEEWKVLKTQYLADLVSEDEAKAYLPELKLTQREMDKWIRNLNRAYALEDAKAALAAKKKAAKTTES